MRTASTRLFQRVSGYLYSSSVRAFWRSRRGRALCASLAGGVLVLLSWIGGRPEPPSEPVTNVQQRPEVGELIRQSHDVYLGWAPRWEPRSWSPRSELQVRPRRSAWLVLPNAGPAAQAFAALVTEPPRLRFASSGGPDGAPARQSPARIAPPRFGAQPLSLGGSPIRLAPAPVVARQDPNPSEGDAAAPSSEAPDRPSSKGPVARATSAGGVTPTAVREKPAPLAYAKATAAEPVARADSAREVAPVAVRAESASLVGETIAPSERDAPDLSSGFAAFWKARDRSPHGADASEPVPSVLQESATAERRLPAGPAALATSEPAGQSPKPRRTLIPEKLAVSTPFVSDDGASAGSGFPGVRTPYVLDFARDVEELVAELPTQLGPRQALQVANTGRLGGSGLVPGDLIVGGLLSPGHSPGVIEVMGDFIQAPGAVLDIELAGPAPEQYDRLVVEGTMVLQGTVNVLLIDDFMPSPGDKFDVLQAADIIADSATFNLPPLVQGRMLEKALTANAFSSGLSIQAVGLGGTMTMTPEPSTGVLFVLGMAGLAFSSRRARVKRPD